MDFIFMGLTFSIGVAACVREYQINKSTNSINIFEFAINKGGFSSAGVKIFITYKLKGFEFLKRN